MTNKQPCTTSFYNGACPVCRTEMQRYRDEALKTDAPLGWVDISRPENADALMAYGITQDMAFRYIYVIDKHGEPQRGVDGLIAIWQDIPRWRWLAQLIGLPIVRPLCTLAYDHILSRAIYHWNRRRLTGQM